MVEPNIQQCLKITGSSCPKGVKGEDYKKPFSYAKVNRIGKI